MYFKIFLLLVQVACLGCGSFVSSANADDGAPVSTPRPVLALSNSVSMPAQDAGDTPAREAEPAAAAPGTQTAAATAPEQPDHDLWDRMRAGFAMDELDTPLVKENEAWYASRPDYVKRMVERSKLYLFHIVEAVEKRGMPTEIALLPMIESAFNPQAYSRSHASGIWQFIPSTGKNFGLQQNWWYDGRRDVPAATDAALDYLQKLHDMFGSWELALAAYNWGEGSVSRAIARNRAKGEPTDYLSLKMPAETRNYVPRLLAVRHLVMQPADFGMSLNSIPDRPYFTSIATKQHIDLNLAARFAEMPLNDFLALNPAHNRPVINQQGSNTLLLPVDKVETFTANLENYNKPLVSWQAYHAARGERLDKIAKKFGLNTARLKQINGLKDRSKKIAAAQILLVPANSRSTGANLPDIAVAATETRLEAPAVSSKLTYTVKKGDTLFSIAKRHGVTPEQIRSWNHLASNHLSHKQKLVINSEAAPQHKRIRITINAPADKQTRYTVRRGDTLASIAHHFKVAVNDIQRWNRISTRHTLRPGERVTLFLARNG